jgi:glycosyltransferase involved in cell wall biosynthesis
MKIVIDAYFAIQRYGGISKYTRELIKSLARIPEPLRLILFYNYFRQQGAIWKTNNSKCSAKRIFFPRHLLVGAWNSFNWPSINLFCGSFDIYHGLHFVLPAVKKAKRILTVHDLTYLKYPEYFSNHSLNERGYKKELPASLKKCDAVIAVSKQTRDDLVDILKYPSENIKVIYHGVHKSFYQRVNKIDVQTVLSKYGINPPYIVYLVGTPEPRKNIPRTIEAWEKVSSSIPLVLVGEKQSLYRIIKSRKNNLILTGYVDDKELRILLNSALIALYPSLYEGFGLPLLESMAAGVPAITSNRSCLPEVAGGAALLVDPNNVDEMAGAIENLLEDESLRKNLKESGLKRSAEFTWEKAAAMTFSLYRELV